MVVRALFAVDNPEVPMLVSLPFGIAVDPETVKLVVIRSDRRAGPNTPMVFTVAIKTDADENFHVVASFDDRAEAEALSSECARRINTGMGEEDPNAGANTAPAKAAAADDDDDDDW